MLSQGNFTQIYTQLSNILSSVDSKTQSLELVDINFMSEEEFILKISQLSSEIPVLQTILKFKDLFSLLPQMDIVAGLFDLRQEKIKNQKIGAGGNAQVFLSTDVYYAQCFALKTIENFNVNMLEFYIQECLNQYDLIQINQDCILNFKGKVYINIVNFKTQLCIPLELAEYSLYDYIQNNEITQEIYQYFYNFFIDILILLHSNNYAHRDIKPQNILFIQGQGWKLADFGDSLKYESRQGLYKIKGTIAFLPQQIRNQIHLSNEIYQNLFKNDIYAIMCTLVMIRNPQFKSKDLINYMDTSEILDQQLQQLQQFLNQEQSIEQLSLLKDHNSKINMEVFTPNIQRANQTFFFNIEQSLQAYYQIGAPVQQNFMNFVDNQLKSFRDYNNQERYSKLILHLILFHPFQIHLLKNFEFNLNIHDQIFQNIRFYFNSSHELYIYLKYFCTEIFSLCFIKLAIKQQSTQLLLSIIDENLKSGNFELAKELLQIVSKFMLNDQNFDSVQQMYFNNLYLIINGQAPINDTSDFQDIFSNQNNYNIYNIQDQFNLQQYLNQNKFFSRYKVNLILLLYPLFPKFDLDYESSIVVYAHIIEVLNINEIDITKDKFLLSNIIKEQLINGGCQYYIQFIYDIIRSVVRLLQHFDLFEGLLELLHYFLNFMQYRSLYIYYCIFSTIQNLIFKLNFSIYHIKDDFNKYNPKMEQVHNQQQYIFKFALILLSNINILQLNQIQYQQKTQQKIHLINQQQIKVILKEVILKKTFSIYNHQAIWKLVKQYAQFLGQMQTELQIYLSLLIVLICKYLYGDGIDQQQFKFKVNSEDIKYKFDPILLKYYILCKQDNRINELFKQWKAYENIKPLKSKIFNPLAEIMLMRLNRLNRTNPNYNFLYLQQISRFVVNQKYRSIFNFKQHLFAANISKSIQKRLEVKNICLKEQYLRLI